MGQVPVRPSIVGARSRQKLATFHVDVGAVVSATWRPSLDHRAQSQDVLLADPAHNHVPRTDCAVSPLHLQPFYQDAKQPRLPVAEDLWQRLLSIPFHPDLTDEEVGRVIEAIRSFAPRRKGRQELL